MPQKKFSVERSAGRAEQEPSFDRGNGKYRERTPCNSPLSKKVASCSGFEGDYGKSNDVGESPTLGMRFMKGGHKRGRNSVRTRRPNLHHLKPISSLESCLMAQLYKEHAEMEDVLAPLPSPCTPGLRPFLEGDGTQIIGRSSYDSISGQDRDNKGKAHIKVYPEANDEVSDGIPRLPEKNRKRGKGPNRPLTTPKGMRNEMQVSSQGSAAAIFYFGVSVGIMSSILANKAEMAKLHDLLKHTQNLVQDLHEELEMKDAVTVRELVNEDGALTYANENSADKLNVNETLVQSNSDKLIKYGDGATCAQKAAETVESMSTIEAELEAELERLELNMKDPTLNGGLSDTDEPDPDFVVQGEFRADILSNKLSSDPSLEHNSSNSSTPSRPSHTPKHAVSPRELSLRLHELIQSRLEQRITELETALEESDKRISQLQSEQQLSCSWRGFSHTDMSSSSFSTRDSPSTIGGSTPVEFYAGPFQEIKKSDGSIIEKQNGTGRGSGHKTPMSSSRLTESEKLCVDEIEEEDEVMKMLIKQIVEKTRQGSPAVLYAHRALVYQDKNEE